MYVTNQNDKGRGGFQLPENYGGSAFRREGESPSGGAGETYRRTPGRPMTPPPSHITHLAEDVLHAPIPEESEEGGACEEEREPFAEEERGEPSAAVAARGLFGGLEIGFEELLLIGLMLVVLQSDADDELWLILAFLLFYR